MVNKKFSIFLEIIIVKIKESPQELVYLYPLFGWVFDIICSDLFMSLIMSSASGSPKSAMDLTAQIESSMSSVCSVTS